MPTEIYADYFLPTKIFKSFVFYFYFWLVTLPVFITADFFVPNKIFADYN